MLKTLRASKFIFNGQTIYFTSDNSEHKTKSIITREYASFNDIETFYAKYKCTVSIASESDLNNAIFLNGHNLLPRKVNSPSIHSMVIPMNAEDVISTTGIKLDMAVFYEKQVQ